MGSSKKHKDKDRERDREHKKKRRHRSRSRSKSPKERRHRDPEEKRRRREHREAREKERPSHPVANVPVTVDPGEFGYDEFPPLDEDLYTETVPEVKPERSSSPVLSAKAAAGGADVTLSIEETNRIRAKLGLKPLDLPGVKKEEDGDDEKPAKKDDVHAPPVNLAQVRKQEEIREKLELAKQRRKIKRKLAKVKTLGESESDEDTRAWVQKNRLIQKQKEEAHKREQMLQEMDAEFGIGSLVEEEFAPKKPVYSSKDLTGMRVLHDSERFKEGKTIILTLQDQAILDEEDDTLVNVNLMDDERIDKNLENKKMKPKYNPYDEPDIDEYGMLKPKDVLSKYDEELSGPKQESFALGSGGRYNAEHERRMQEFKQAMKEKGETLHLPPPKIASEFFTSTEMEGFNKVKKKIRKVRKKPKMLKADDLLPLGDEANDLGSRSELQVTHEEVHIPGLGDIPIKLEPDDDPQRMEQDMDIEEEDPFNTFEIVGPDEDLTGITINDEPANELESALNKARKLKQQKASFKVSDVVQAADMDEDAVAAGAQLNNIVLNSTSEFCRSLGEIPTYGMAGNRVEDEDELLDFENELMEERRRQEEEDESGTGWQAVEIDTRPVDIKDEDGAALEEEPVIDSGLSSALKLATKKGFLAEENSKKGPTGSAARDLAAKHYSIEDKRYDDLDEKYRKRDRFTSGVTVDFKELNYKPEVKLEYVDETGRQLSAKEAFRQLSHRFHGKGSGKKKTEKRGKKLEQEQLLKNASSTDTPLGTVELLRGKQRAEKAAFVVLSGHNKTTSLLPQTISKTT